MRFFRGRGTSERDTPPATHAPPPAGAGSRFANGLFYAGAVWGFVAIVGIGTYVQWQWTRIGLAALTTFGAASAGAVLGFLFGVPKAGGNEGVRRVADGSYRPNTNLEQVSDWLTKIIVGVGLIQIGQIGNGIGYIGEHVGAAIGNIDNLPGSGTVFAIGLLGGSTAVAFLLVYMWTCTRLYEVFSSQEVGSTLQPEQGDRPASGELPSTAGPATSAESVGGTTTPTDRLDPR